MQRIWQHRNGQSRFTARYHIDRLVYYEQTPNVGAAIAREKELKGWTRRRKIELIESVNLDWHDLAGDWFEAGAG
jgi:putative endonuclease